MWMGWASVATKTRCGWPRVGGAIESLRSSRPRAGLSKKHKAHDRARTEKRARGSSAHAGRRACLAIRRHFDGLLGGCFQRKFPPCRVYSFPLPPSAWQTCLPYSMNVPKRQRPPSASNPASPLHSAQPPPSLSSRPALTTLPPRASRRIAPGRVVVAVARSPPDILRAPHGGGGGGERRVKKVGLVDAGDEQRRGDRRGRGGGLQRGGGGARGRGAGRRGQCRAPRGGGGGRGEGRGQLRGRERRVGKGAVAGWCRRGGAGRGGAMRGRQRVGVRGAGGAGIDGLDGVAGGRVARLGRWGRAARGFGGRHRRKCFGRVRCSARGGLQRPKSDAEKGKAGS